MRNRLVRQRAAGVLAASRDASVPKTKTAARMVVRGACAVMIAAAGLTLTLGGSALAASPAPDIAQVGSTTLSSIALNGVPATATDVAPGTAVTISATWSDNNTSCTQCIDFVAVGWSGHSQAGCIENQGRYGESTAGSVDLGPAPTTPGTYDIVASFEEVYSCGQSWSASASAGYQVVAQVVVPTPAPSLTVRRIYGATADATAAAELASAFPAGQCPGTAGARPVVLATDTRYADALSSSYLASYLGTGTLLTPTGLLSAPTKTTLQDEGITHVYVVGGPLAVSTAVVSAIEGLPVYDCGGRAATGSHIAVSRIAGTSEYTTAEDVAGTPPASFVGAANLFGAYAGTNATGGVGRYNATAGAASAAPPVTSARKTAILATAASFQDAESAATLSYADHLPILLTTPTSLSSQAQSAIGRLGVTQVIVIGGQLAISNTVVHRLQALGVSALRVAGTDYTGTAVEMAGLETAPAGEGFGWDARTAGLAVARGDAFSDGLAGAVAAAHGIHGSGPVPLLLTEGTNTVGQDVTTFLRHVEAAGLGADHAPVSYLLVLGGPDAVSASLARAIERDL